MLLPAQALESTRKRTCNRLSKSVTRGFQDENSLYGRDGSRKYLNQAERSRYLAAARSLDTSRCLFAQMLAWTGARLSELLSLSPQCFQVDANIVTLTTLKRRKFVVREIPIPPALMARLNTFFGLRREQRVELGASRRLWPFCRQTAWRFIKNLMVAARISGRQACPRGVRHSFGVGTLQSGVPLNLIQRWMGHARLSTTAIYASVCGPEEVAFARRFWSRGEAAGAPSSWL